MIEKILSEIKRILEDLGKKDVLAAGLFGSLARGDFNERSDIDIFIITEKELEIKEQDKFYYAFSKLRGKFGRDTTVLVYDIRSLRKVPSWQTLNMVRDAIFAYDVANVRDIFKKILDEAEKHGIFYDERERIFRSRKRGRIVFSLEDNV
ncbi:MAG: nucleotidyltransferase family protein [Thermoproteota archaeon]